MPELEFLIQLWLLSAFCLPYISLGSDEIFINCGSFKNVSLDNRIFVADNSYPNILTTLEDIVANTTLDSNSVIPTNDLFLYETARIFTGPSSYKFPIKTHGRYWIRLHFFPFNSVNYDLGMAKFSVSAKNFTLIKEYRPENSSVVKEYSLNITSDELILEFAPRPDSFAFLSALEVFRLPNELIPVQAKVVGFQGKRNLGQQALETVARVNMGNLMVNRSQDKLWRLWVSDSAYLGHDNLGKVVSDIESVNFTVGVTVTDLIAPSFVYGTATELNSDDDPNTRANVTWNFEVDPGFEYLVRLHFCDIINRPDQQLIFKIFINSLFFTQLDLRDITHYIVGAPYFDNLIINVRENRALKVSVGPSDEGYPNAILNGMEIMKMNNKKGSLDVLDSVFPKRSASKKSPKLKTGLIAGLAAGLFIAFLLGLSLFLFCRRRRKVLQTVHSGKDDQFTVGGRDVVNIQSFGSAMFSSSKKGYRFPLAAIKEATDNFNESLVIGIGGFGKVYMGVLRDETKVAVKRGAHQSQQGLSEFKTEIEMLSQFRHRHLVSLIGYCKENNEMIIVYEYMENGTLKNHLYSSDCPSLSWRQRLEICIGSARGLHYLHTGSTKPIIHRDVKSANVLLDKNLMAKVADFGLSKTGPDLDQTHVSTAVKGSFGYLDPEYLTRQKLTEKSDVYSFGVVMFEVVCGRTVIDPSLPRERVNLIEWALKWQRNGKLDEIIDPFLMGQVKSESLKKFCEIAGKCLAERGVDRPTMGDVLWNLEFALQLQGNEDGSDGGNQTDRVDQMDASAVSTVQFSVASVGDDLVGVSMSKVFAKMVDMKETR